jgi:membrane-associated phospholipid phosphatase
MAVRRILRAVRGRLRRADRRLLRTMRTGLHGPPLEAGVKALGYAGEWGAVWIAIALAVAALDEGRRTRWLRAAAVAPAAVGLNYAVKVSVRRDRPRLRRLPPLSRAPSALSFPSAHATSSWAAAIAMGRVSPSARPPLFALAAAICLGRPYLGMHYPSDVLAGAALGVAIGALWPGLRGEDAEDRLIDLVARSPRASNTPPSPDVPPSQSAGDGSSRSSVTRS